MRTFYVRGLFLLFILASFSLPVCASSSNQKNATLEITTGSVKGHSHFFVDKGEVSMPKVAVAALFIEPHGTPREHINNIGPIKAAHARDAVNESISYLRTAAGARSIFKRIDKSGGVIIIVVNNSCENAQSPGKNTSIAIVLWDPSCAYRFKKGTVSPSITLLHELVHAMHQFENPAHYFARAGLNNKDYDNDEERETIINGEMPVAIELGEAIRYNHNEGQTFFVYNPTLR